MYHYSEFKNKDWFVMLESMFDSWDETYLLMIYWSYNT